MAIIKSVSYGDTFRPPADTSARETYTIVHKTPTEAIRYLSLDAGERRRLALAIARSDRFDGRKNGSH